MLRRQEAAADVDGHHTVPKVRVNVEAADRFQRRVKGGIVDKDVKPAQIRFHHLSEVPDRALVAYVGGDLRSLPSGGPDLRDHRLGAGDVGDQTVGSFRCHGPGKRCPEPFGAPGDDGLSSLEPSHGRGPLAGDRPQIFNSRPAGPCRTLVTGLARVSDASSS